LNSFENERENGGGHAMCIVAYNDTLQGGAFKIANSWGKDWGDKGFCWLKYSDLKYISMAFAMFGNFDHVKKSEGLFMTEKLEFLNSTDSLFFISLAYKTKNGTVSFGWFEVPVNFKKSIDISDRTSNEIFWTALNEKGQSINLNCENNCSSYPVLETGAYEWSTDKPEDGSKNFAFKKIEPNNLKLAETIVLGYSSDQKKKVLMDFCEINNNDLEIMNKNWDGKYPLVDPYSGEVIIRNLNSDQKFTVYFKENNQIKSVTAKIKVLSKIHQAKFLNESNLMNYHKK
jgi:hypothetical protein